MTTSPIDPEVIGLIAGCLTTASFVPQALKIWRSRSVGDLSVVMWLCMTVGVALWLIYGCLLGAISVILANLITLGFACSILLAKLRFNRRAG